MVLKAKTLIPMEKQLSIFIRYISSQMTIQNIADNFGVSEYTVFDIVKRVSDEICEQLMPKYITWPEEERVDEIVNDFRNHRGFPGVIGAIDGSHIPIKTPESYPENYINRKSFASVNLQAVCDSNMHLLNVSCGWPGSVHDARVMKNVPLYAKIETDMESVSPRNAHLLGDSAYGITPWLMTLFRDCGNLTKQQRKYNCIHSSTRLSIELTFGTLKGRFRRLKCIDMLDIAKIVKVVLSCCTVHEICLGNQDGTVEFLEDGPEEVNNFQNIVNLDNAEESKRRDIMHLLTEL